MTVKGSLIDTPLEANDAQEQFEFHDNSQDGITFYIANRKCLHLSPTATGFDVVIPEGISMTEAAADFVYVLKDQIQHLWKTTGEPGGNA